MICFKIPVALRCRDLSVSERKEKPEEKERGETEMRHPWRRAWQPTPVLLPGKSHGWRSLVGYSP